MLIIILHYVDYGVINGRIARSLNNLNKSLISNRLIESIIRWQECEIVMYSIATISGWQGLPILETIRDIMKIIIHMMIKHIMDNFL